MKHNLEVAQNCEVRFKQVDEKANSMEKRLDELVETEKRMKELEARMTMMEMDHSIDLNKQN